MWPTKQYIKHIHSCTQCGLETCKLSQMSRHHFTHHMLSATCDVFRRLWGAVASITETYPGGVTCICVTEIATYRGSNGVTYSGSNVVQHCSAAVPPEQYNLYWGVMGCSGSCTALIRTQGFKE